jgi:hypothetical protein
VEREGLLPNSQQPAPSPCPDSGQFSPCSHPTSCRSVSILSSRVDVGIATGLSFRFHHQNPVCTSHLYRTCYISFFFLTRIIFGEHYRSLSSSLCSFLHSLVPLSLLHPNILLSTLFINTFTPVPPSVLATKLHTHTEQQAKLYSLSETKINAINREAVLQCRGCQRTDSCSTDALLMTVADRLSQHQLGDARWWSRWPLKDTSWLRRTYFRKGRHHKNGRAFESRRWHGRLSFVSVVCCQVEVSASDRSLV